MKYALGNMLNGAGGLNADQLALDLPFAVTKSLTAAKGPTPTFTRASSGTFVGSNGLIQSAGNNVARFDHDPVTLASRGLLIEESRTNLSLYSGAIVQNTGWTGNATPSVSGTGPDGNSSYQISESTINGIQSIANTGGTGSVQATTVTNGTTYTGSVFVKKVAGSIDWVQLTFGGAGFMSTLYANFNISTGTVGNSAGLASGTVPRIEAYGDGWYRISVTATATSTIATNNIIVGFIQNTNGTTRLPSYSGSTSNRFLASLGQFEVGTFATSYIPTTTASVVRSGDVCSITGAAFSGFYNQPEGTLFADVTPQTVDQSSLVLGVNTSTFSNSHLIYKINATFSAIGRRWGTSSNMAISQEVSIVTPTDVATSRSRLAYGYKLNNYAFAYAGGIVGTDTLANVPSPTSMRIGSRDDGLFINGHLASVRYYRLRLSNAKLQAITV